MKLLLDTNICIYIIKRHPPEVLGRFLDFQPGDIGISTITLAELEFGVAKSQHRQKNATALEEFLFPLEILPFDESAATVYGAIRSALERAGTPIGALDLLIAAHALALDVPLVTSNRREFERVPRLQVMDWAR